MRALLIIALCSFSSNLAAEVICNPRADITAIAAEPSVVANKNVVFSLGNHAKVRVLEQKVWNRSKWVKIEFREDKFSKPQTGFLLAYKVAKNCKISGLIGGQKPLSNVPTIKPVNSGITGHRRVVVCNRQQQVTNIRSGPSTKTHAVLDSVPNNTSAIVLQVLKNSEGFEWAKIAYRDRPGAKVKRGFIYSMALAVTCDRPSGEARVASTPPAGTSAGALGLVIPASMLIRSRKDCAHVNPRPQPNETIEWTGGCSKGLAWGRGVRRWNKNGRFVSSENVDLEAGFDLRPYLPDARVFGLAIQSPKNGRPCEFILPINAMLAHSKKFSVEYLGSCPRPLGFSNLGASKENVVAKIMLAGQPFAEFKGVVAGGFVPVSGEMRFFTGARWTFRDTVQIDKLSIYIHGQRWIQNISYVPGRSPDAKSTAVASNAFALRLAFGATPVPAASSNIGFLLFKATVVDADADLNLRYSLSPSGKVSLSGRRYRIVFETIVELGESTSSGWIGISTKRDIRKTVSVVLSRDNNFSASSHVSLGRLSTFSASLLATTKVSSVRPKARILSITELNR
ncbi:MAG: hypothetical protein AB7F96_07610 [Beijerinckiaceae bacterium]